MSNADEAPSQSKAAAPEANSGKAAQEKFWLGFDLGGTKMMAAVLDANWKVRGRKRRRTKGHEGTKSTLERINRTVRDALDEAEITSDQLAGLGIGCPGPVNSAKGTVIEAPNLGWKDVNIRKALADEFGCPVTVLNDVDAGVYGEFRFGAGRKAHSVLGVFPGTGIGGGFVLNGQILQGHNISCMEIGHMQIMSDGPPTSGIASGSLEAVGSRLAIAASSAQAAYRGQAPHLLKSAGTDLREIRSSVLADSVESGDKAVEEIILAAAGHIGRAVGGLIHLLAPDVIVLGGGLAEALPKLLTQAVSKTISDFVLPSYKDCWKLVVAELGDDAAVLGAAAWAEEMQK